MYNAAHNDHNRDQIEQWASSAYPEVWAELLKLGRTTGEGGAASEDGEEVGEDDDNEDIRPTALMDATIVSGQGGSFKIDRSVEA